MKNAIVTCLFGDKYKAISELTHPTIKAYADKVGADFVIIDENKLSKNLLHYEKFQIRGLFSKYYRIVYVDSDMIIRDDCPDLFSIVPEDKIGIFNEGAFTNCINIIQDAVVKFRSSLKLSGPFQYKGQYYNTGIMVLSRRHKDIFVMPDEEHDWYNAGANSVAHFEQPYINLKIITGEYPVHDLSYKFNRMFITDNFTGENKLASYVVHYAGLTYSDDILEIIQKDITDWKNNPSYKYQRKLYVSVGGGLGDQIDAEPVVRYAMETLYPGDDFVIRTDFPEIFDHLSGAKIVTKNVDITGRFKMETLPSPESPLWQHIAQTMCHTTDFASISALRRVLPNKDKQIFLPVSEYDIESLKKTIGIDDLKNLILIHPGRGWESKTFPSEYWNSIIKLISTEYPVAVIGKSISKEQGLVNVNCETAIDLRDLLNLRELITIISQSKILISNDSAPIHIAGAFDNWIFLIPSCKHPDHILPYRDNGNQYYKTRSFYKRLTCDDIDSSPTNIDGQTIDYVKDDIIKYLEAPEVILKVVEEHYE